MKLQGDDGWWMVGDDGGARKEELPTRTAEDRMGADRSRGGFCFLFFVFCFFLAGLWLALGSVGTARTVLPLLSKEPLKR